MQQCKALAHTLQLLTHVTENIRVKPNAKAVGVELNVFGAFVRRQLREVIDRHVRPELPVGVACP